MMVPLDNIARITESSGPPVITHYNLFRSVEIDGSPAPGVSSSVGLTAMENLAKQIGAEVGVRSAPGAGTAPEVRLAV